MKLPLNIKQTEEYYLIDSDNKIISKYRLYNSARNDIPYFRKIHGFYIRVITRTEYEKLVTIK